MNSLDLKNKSGFLIEEIEDTKGSEVYFCGERGGIITSLKIGGKEILYFNKEIFDHKDLNVRGGIPILFPNAGPIRSEIITDELKNKQHLRKFHITRA